MLDKRESMLNEKDSLTELALTEETLFKEYAHAALCVERKEVREFLFSRLKTIAEDLQKISGKELSKGEI